MFLIRERHFYARSSLVSLTLNFCRSVSQDVANINHWLNAPDPSSNHNNARKKRQPTTGEWFLKSANFSDWKAQSKSLLWLHGIPGCGKTVLCSAIVEHVMDQCNSEARAAMAYFYFDFNNSAKQGTESFLRSILSQLLAQCPAVPDQFLSAFAQSQKGQHQPRFETMSTLLSVVLRSFRTSFIVIDALDECTTRPELLEFIGILTVRELPPLPS